MQITQVYIDELKETIDYALQRLYEVDYYLIENQVNERSIVFRFGLYFSELLLKSSFKQLNLDCEYNRNQGHPKRTENFPKGVLPDVLLHRRSLNTENLLVMEFKGNWNRKGRKRDMGKLIDFTNQGGEYQYAIGAFVDIHKAGPVIKYYQDYNPDDNSTYLQIS